MSSIESINIGAPQPLDIGRRQITTGIFKTPVAGPVRVDTLGLEGDVQINRRFHGGPDKALNVYPIEHLPYWSERLGTTLSVGAFGENLSTRGLLETEVATGDVFQCGEVMLEVTQPRQPCGTLAARHGEPRLVRWVEASGFTGFYFRILATGTLTAGAELVLRERPADPITIVEAYRILRDKDDLAAARRLLANPALSQAWREELQGRL